jgi:hypothetical protein
MSCTMPITRQRRAIGRVARSGRSRPPTRKPPSGPREAELGVEQASGRARDLVEAWPAPCGRSSGCATRMKSLQRHVEGRDAEQRKDLVRPVQLVVHEVVVPHRHAARLERHLQTRVTPSSPVGDRFLADCARPAVPTAGRVARPFVSALGSCRAQQLAVPPTGRRTCDGTQQVRGRARELRPAIPLPLGGVARTSRGRCQSPARHRGAFPTRWPSARRR